MEKAVIFIEHLFHNTEYLKLFISYLSPKEVKQTCFFQPLPFPQVAL